MNRSYVMGLGLAAALLCAVLLRVDLRELTAIWCTVQLPLLLLALGLKITVIYVKSWRWARAIEAAQGRRPRHAVFAASLLGIAGNLLLPARLGDAGRVALLARRNEFPIGLSVATAGVCHLFDLALLAIGLVVLSLSRLGGSVTSWVPVTLVVLALAASCVAVGLSSRSLTLRRLLTRALPQRVQAVGRDLWQGVAGLHRSPQLPALIGSTLVVWSLEFAAMLVVVAAFGLPASWLLAWALVVTLNLSFALPVTPGNIGTHQVVSVLVLALFGVSRVSALAFSIGWQGAVHLTVLTLGALVACWEGPELQALWRKANARAHA